jgi:hypothetical protein
MPEMLDFRKQEYLAEKMLKLIQHDEANGQALNGIN